MEQLAKPQQATGRAVGIRRDGNDDEMGNFTVI